jgi:PST family polysaccharide transporter
MSDTAGTAPSTRESLDRSALSGVAWASAAKWSTQILAWVGTVLVARILVPADFGLLTTASVFVGLVMILSEFGIGTAVITMRELNDESLAQLNGFSVMLGLGGTLLTALMAYPLGLFFRAPSLPPVLMLVGLTFFIHSIQTVPAALLRRELQYRTIAMVDVTRGLIVPFVTLLGALLGMRYWALAVGNVVGACITTAMTISYRRVPLLWPRTKGIESVLHFSRDILLGRLAWIAYQNGDFAVAARRLRMSAVGDYGMAWTLATGPLEKVTMVLADVTPALFSAVQNDRPSLRRYFLLLTEALCVITFPAAVGLALISSDLVAVALGPKWTGAVAPIALLAVYAGARSVSMLFGHVLNATRETRFAMWTSIVLAIVIIIGFIIGSAWGPVGIASAWLIVHPSFSLVTFSRVRKVLDLSVWTYLRALRMGLDGSLIMAATILAFQHYLAADWQPWTRLIASIVVGASAFAAATFLIHGARLKEIVAWLKRVRSGGQG